ncbi:nicastrin [Tetranychus urticae]|uniref:Nicastrin n=1 Tax=Tetranychus urticae TaxID=32264 RepID=T1L1W7_TETUR|nr:nicastrin [Tetranychus urticae]
MFKLILSIIFSLSTLDAVTADRIARGKIYRDIESKYFCIRRLNATHQFGCQSDFSGSIGALHLVASSNGQIDNDDVKFITSEGSTPPYIPVINVDSLTTKVMEQFRDSGRVSGVIVIKHNDTKLSVFSTDKSCPNEDYGLYTSAFNKSYAEYDNCAKQKWNNPNNPVSELFYRDFGFPVLMIENTVDIDDILQCIDKYGVTKQNSKRSWPLCSAELFIHMNAAKDSKTCIRRNGYSVQLDNAIRYCDPLGSFNIFNPFIPINSNFTVPDKSLIVVASRLDSFSLFFDKTPGADSPVTSIAVILSIAETLGKIRDKITSKQKANRNILFSLFNGESFDYIGSGRATYDLKKKILKGLSTSDLKQLDLTTLSLDHLSSFIELGQLAPHSSDDIYLHTDPISTKDPTTLSLVNALIANLKKPTTISLKESPKDLPLPPASFQSFLRENLKLPGVFLANHNGLYENKFYNSFADDYSNVEFEKDSKSDAKIVQHLANISTQISQALYEMLTDESDLSIKSDPNTISDLLYCFIIDASCPLFVKHGFNISSASQLEGLKTLPFYVSVRQQFTSSFYLMSIIAQILATFTGTFLDADKDKCTKLKAANKWLSYYYIPGFSPNRSCIESQVFATEAVSPVFINNEPDWSLPYSTWTESIWDQPSVRIFLQPGPNQEWATLTVGLLITSLSFLIVRFVRNKSKTLFKLPGDNGVSLMRENGVDC